MYELARDISDQGRTIPKGTPVSDVHELPGHAGHVTALAHIWGTQIKLSLINSDLADRRQKRQEIPKS